MKNSMLISNMEYDVQTIRNVIALNRQLGEISIHDAKEGYLLIFKNCPDDVEKSKDEFLSRLDDFTNNIWSH